MGQVASGEEGTPREGDQLLEVTATARHAPSLLASRPPAPCHLTSRRCRVRRAKAQRRRLVAG
jgi:hypothetical protein